MSQPEPLAPPEPLGPLRRRDGQPLFEEPWQAQALGMADLLVGAGVIGAGAWSAELGKQLRKGASAGAPDDLDTYYGAVLAALQTLLYATGATAREEVDTCEAEWRRAYLATPHGKPVELAASSHNDSRDHA